jgi:hypothetical protein
MGLSTAEASTQSYCFASGFSDPFRGTKRSRRKGRPPEGAFGEPDQLSGFDAAHGMAEKRPPIGASGILH